MAAIINGIAPISKHRRISAALFKPKSNKYKTINYDASNVMQNNTLNKKDKFLFFIIDKISPIMHKHPKLGDKIMIITEKMIKKQSSILNTIDYNI